MFTPTIITQDNFIELILSSRLNELASIVPNANYQKITSFELQFVNTNLQQLTIGDAVLSNALLRTNILIKLDFYAQNFFKFWSFLDISMIILELIIFINIFLFIKKFNNQTLTHRAIQEAFISFCQTKGISMTEVVAVTTLVTGFLIFDIFVVAVEDDFIEIFFFATFLLCTLTIIGILISIDVQYFYMISGLSGGDMSLRILFQDISNNMLCVLRIMFCFIRYLFYDFQVECVDMAFHYSDSINRSTIFSWVYNDLEYNKLTHVGLSFFIRFIFGSILLIFFDYSLFLIQINLTIFKFFIAIYLLWLLLDLFILRSFARTESNGLRSHRHYFHKILCL